MVKRFFEEPLSTIMEFGLVIFVRLLIDIGYEMIISTYFHYAGFHNNLSISSEILSWIAFFLSFPILHYISSNKKDRASAIVFQTLYYLSFLPFTTCLKYGLFDSKYVTFALIFWFAMFSFEVINISSTVKPFPVIRFSEREISSFILAIAALFSCAVTIAICYRYTGLRLHIDLLTAYDLREEAVRYNLSSLEGYFFSWTRAINPFMLAYSYLKNKKCYTVLFVLCCLFNFGFDGSKTALFLPIAFLLIALLCKHYSLNIKKMIIYVFLFVGMFCMAEYIVNDTYYLCSYFIRRTMMVENLNSAYYFDFFTNNTPDYFRMSFLRLFGFHTPYPGLAKTIGRLYQNRETNANCGLMADAITNFGLIGMIAYPLLVFALMRILDKLSFYASSPLRICVGLYIGLHLVNSFFMTSLVTHGILLLLILIYCSSGEKRLREA